MNLSLYIQVWWRPLVEIAVLAIAIYYILIFVRGTRGWPIVIGFVVMTGLAFFSQMLKLEVLAGTTRTTQAWAQGAQNDIKEIGVDLELKPTEATAFLTAWIRGEWKDIHTQGESSQKPLDVDGWIPDNYTSTSPRNFTGYRDARADQLGEQQRRELDPQKRRMILQELLAYLRDQQPIVQLGSWSHYPSWQPYPPLTDFSPSACET